MEARRRNVIQCASLALVLSGCSNEGSGGNSTITFTVGPSSLMFAAAQVADGPWMVITPSVGGEYSFAAIGQTYGVVAVCGDQNAATITVLQATTAETTTPSLDCVVVGDPQASVTGAIAGASDQYVLLDAANYETGIKRTGVANYSLMAPAGIWDVFAQRQPAQLQTDRIIRRNEVTLAENAPTVVDFDFTTEGFAPEAHAVAFEGLQSSETTRVTSTLRSRPGGTWLDMGFSTAGAFRAFPVGELRADDIQIVTATATLEDDSYRQIRRFFVGAEDFTAALPSMPPPSLVESETPTPYLRMRGTIPGGLDVDRYDLVYVQSRPDHTTMTWTAGLSRGYRELEADVYTLPDLSELVGFDLMWGLLPGMPVNWQVVASSSDAGPANLFGGDQSASALDGRTHTSTQQTGRFPL